MQLQKFQLTEIQAQNQQTVKKLESFRSGLQKLMKKKSNKKQSQKQKIKPSHQQPSRDYNPSFNKSPNNYTAHQPNTNFSYNKLITSNKNNNINLNMQKTQSQNQPTFGFNSTLFKQLNDNQSNVMSNSSTNNLGNLLNNQNYNNNNHINNYPFAYNSTSNYNSVGSNGYSNSNNQYFSTSSKGYSQQQENYASNSSYPYRDNNYNSNMSQIKEQDSFKQSFKLFNQVDDLIAKVNKTSKLPRKQIEKYISKNQQKSKGKEYNKNAGKEYLYDDLDLDISKSDLIVKQFYQNRGRDKDKNEEGSMSGRSRRVSEKDESKEKNYKQSGEKKQKNHKDNIKQTNQFLKNYKQKTNSIIGLQNTLKMPPLPPSSSSQSDWLSQKKQIANQYRQKFGQSVTSSKQNSNAKKDSIKSNSKTLFKQQQQAQLQKSPSKSSSLKQQTSVVQIHKNRIKQTLSQRKKMMKQQGFLDDSIELELSEQQQQNQHNQDQNEEQISKQQQQILQLKQQKKKLLQQLQLIQAQLQKLQNQD